MTTLPTTPSLVESVVTHQRRMPLRHGFRYRVLLWLVDIDHLPRFPWYLRPFATVTSADHLGPGSEPLRTKVERLLTHHGFVLGPGSRVVMLTGAKVLGHGFDPLSVFWCFSAQELVCVLAEVHNTYGERHVYVVRPDERGGAEADKRFYVSPFNDVAGRYELGFDLTPARVEVTIRLRRQGRSPFQAGLQGKLRPATRRAVALAQLRYPLMPQRVSALIRLHGAYLWLRRLPVVTRAPHHPQEGLSS